MEHSADVTAHTFTNTFVFLSPTEDVPLRHTGFPLFRWKKFRSFSGLPRIPVRNFQGPFGAHECLNNKYKEKTPFTHNIWSIVHCRNRSKKQTVDCSCFQKSDELIYMISIFLLVSIRTNKKCVIFKDFFQDFPGP